MSSSDAPLSFAQLELPQPLQQALLDVGYETPSPIQAQIIPHMLNGSDVLGQAQTGTGKTAAFALPVLARLDPKQKSPQVLVLAPTRELAIQVAEAFQKYAKHLRDFHVVPIYGGADYRTQQRQLQRGAHVVVGTPGRVMDHMRRGSLDISTLRTLILDEADEMLRMGFIEDVQWILQHTPSTRQTALFSATMPSVIRKIAQQYLTDPVQISIEVKTVTNASIRQRVWMISGMKKIDALTRILEVEDTDGIIIFVRTRIMTVELADKLAARGYSVAALNGDIAQSQREQTVNKLKGGKLDIVVATDVAARGLDVQRVSHVINYDIPSDVEAYIHRIGRTGRAGREGDAILFAANRERRLLRAIEKATGNQIEKMELPTAEQITDKRIGKFKQRISETLAAEKLDDMKTLIQDYQNEHGVPIVEIAAALGVLAQGNQSAKLQFQESSGNPSAVRRRSERGEGGSDRQEKKRPERSHKAKAAKPSSAGEQKADKPVAQRPAQDAGKSSSKGSSPSKSNSSSQTAAPEKARDAAKLDVGMEKFRVEVGRNHEVNPGNIVGAIANEAEIESEYIGRIEIFDDHSTVELPEGMPKEIFKHLRTVWVSGQRLQISKIGDSRPAGRAQKKKPAASGGDKPRAKKPRSKPGFSKNPKAGRDNSK